MTPAEIEDAIAACNLLPGPASTQLAMFCAWRVAGVPGVIVGGLCFICPGSRPDPRAVGAVPRPTPRPHGFAGPAPGAGAAVAAVAVQAGAGLLGPSWARAGAAVARAGARWLAYVALGGVAAALVGPYLVLVLLACGAGRARCSGGRGEPPDLRIRPAGALIAAFAGAGGLGALAWVAFKVGALSYGGGFVIVPLMQTRRRSHLPLDELGASSWTRSRSVR